VVVFTIRYESTGGLFKAPASVTRLGGAERLLFFAGENTIGAPWARNFFYKARSFQNRKMPSLSARRFPGLLELITVRFSESGKMLAG
jgi:hypothetical protein